MRLLGCKNLGRRKSDEWVVLDPFVREHVTPKSDAWPDFMCLVFTEEGTAVAGYRRQPARWVVADFDRVRESGGA